MLGRSETWQPAVAARGPITNDATQNAIGTARRGQAWRLGHRNGAKAPVGEGTLVGKGDVSNLGTAGSDRQA